MLTLDTAELGWHFPAVLLAGRRKSPRWDDGWCWLSSWHWSRGRVSCTWGRFVKILILHHHHSTQTTLRLLISTFSNIGTFWWKKRSETQIDLIKFLIANGSKLGMLINSHCSPDLYFMFWKFLVFISNSRKWSSHWELPPYWGYKIDHLYNIIANYRKWMD